MKTILLFVLSVAISGCVCSEARRFYRNNLTNIETGGMVVKKYTDTPDRTNEKVMFNNGETYTIYNEYAFDLIEIGDSIEKSKGTLKSLLKKKDTTIVFYPICCGAEVKD